MILSLGKITSELKTAYSNNELDNANDAAVTLVKSVPVLGDFASIVIKKPEEQVDIKTALKVINENMNAIKNEIQNVGTKIDDLGRQIDFSIVQTQIADRKVQIYSCYQDFLNFLGNTKSTENQDSVKSCYKSRQDIRQIGLMLTNAESPTFNIEPVYDELIKLVGLCDGEVINEFYQYLLGLYTQGCTVLSVAEALIYKNKSTPLRDECHKTITHSKEVLQVVYDKCQMEHCKIYVPKLESILKNDTISDIQTILKQTFPWFHFFILILDSNSDITFKEGDINRLTILNKEIDNRVAIWSTQRNTNFTSHFSYGMECTQASVMFKYDDLNLEETNKDDSELKTVYTGFYQIPQQVCVQLVETTTITPSDNENDVKKFFNKNVNMTLKVWHIMFIIIALIFVFIAMYQIMKYLRRRGEDDA